MKHGPACRQCRLGKRKCDRPTSISCQQCLKRGLSCSSAAIIRSTTAIRPADSSHQSSSGLSKTCEHDHDDPPGSQDVLSRMSQEVISELVEHYILYVHDKPHSLFHVPSLREAVDTRSLDKTLLCAILALSARFSTSESTRHLGKQLAVQAERLATADFETASLATIQAWVILGNVCGAESRFTSETLFFTIAIRLAYIIRLEHPSRDGTVVEQETRSRTWWTLHMLDRWSSAGLGLPRQMYSGISTHKLPRSELLFHALQPAAQSWPVEEPSLGMWAHMIILVDSFGPIQDLNRLLITQNPADEYISGTVHDIADALETWHRNLPESISWSPESLAYHASQGHGSTLVALHLGYHHYATLLYFQYLDPDATSLPHSNMYARRCSAHASALSDLLRTSYEHSGCEAAYNIVGHMTVVSSSVLIYTLLFGSLETLDRVKDQLVSNFRILMKLKVWWPSVEPMTRKLHSFQRACLRSIDKHTHKVDRWMLKFLLEHGSPLDEEREQTAQTPSTVSELSWFDIGESWTERHEATTQALSYLTY